MVGNGFFEPSVITNKNCPLAKMTIKDLKLKKTPFYQHTEKITLGEFLDFHKKGHVAIPLIRN